MTAVILYNEKYNEREWFNDLNAREKLFYLSLESIYELYKNKNKG